MGRKVVKNVEGYFKTLWLVGRREEEFYILRTVAKEVKKAVIVFDLLSCRFLTSFSPFSFPHLFFLSQP